MKKGVGECFYIIFDCILPFDKCMNMGDCLRAISYDWCMILTACILTNAWQEATFFSGLHIFLQHVVCFHRYRALGIVTADKGPDAPVKRAQQAQRKFERQRLRAQVYDVNNTSRRQVQGPGHFQR